MSHVFNKYRSQDVSSVSGTLNGVDMEADHIATIPVAAKRIVYARFVTIEDNPASVEYYDQDPTTFAILLIPNDPSEPRDISYVLRYTTQPDLTEVVLVTVAQALPPIPDIPGLAIDLREGDFDGGDLWVDRVGDVGFVNSFATLSDTHVYLDGTSFFTAEGLVLDPGPITTSAWIKLTNKSGIHQSPYIFDSSNGGSSSGFFLQLETNSNQPMYSGLAQRNGQGYTTKSAPGEISNLPFTLNTWYHVVSVVNPSTDVNKMFINGQEITADRVVHDITVPDYVGNSLPNLVVGGRSNGINNLFQGYLGDVFISTTALTAEEVLEYFNATAYYYFATQPVPPTPPEPPPIIPAITGLHMYLHEYYFSGGDTWVDSQSGMVFDNTGVTKIGTHLYLDGHARFTNNPLVIPAGQDFTVSCWVKMGSRVSTFSDPHILDGANNNNVYGFSLGLDTTTITPLQGFVKQQNDEVLYIRSAAGEIPAEQLETGVWTNYMIAFDMTNHSDHKMYVNGVEISTEEFIDELTTPSPVGDTEPLTVGSTGTQNGHHLQGYLGDVFIAYALLTPAEALQYYNDTASRFS